MQNQVEIIEVGPRKGLQYHQQYIDVKYKISLIQKLFEAGFKRMEVTSLVHPKEMPQMKDGLDVLQNIKIGPDQIKQVLVPNEIGCRNAIAYGAQELVVWVYITDELNRLSLKCDRSATLKEINSIIQIADANGIKVTAWIAGAFGYPGMNLPFVEEVRALAAKLILLGCVDVCLGDEFCMANPFLVKKYLNVYFKEIDQSKLLLHFNENRGLGLANYIAAYEEGIRKFKTCISGIGGQMYLGARKEDGVSHTIFPTIATEDLVYVFEEMGISTGLDLDKLIESGRYAETFFKKKLHSLVIANHLYEADSEARPLSNLKFYRV